MDEDIVKKDTKDMEILKHIFIAKIMSMVEIMPKQGVCLKIWVWIMINGYHRQKRIMCI